MCLFSPSTVCVSQLSQTLPICLPVHYPLAHVEFFLYRTLGAPFGAPPCPTHGDSDIVLDPTRECVDISNSAPRSSASRNILTS